MRTRLKEINVVKKNVGKDTIRVALLYPSYYEVAASSLAYQMLYYFLNSYSEVYAERFVLSDDFYQPGIYSIETRSSLKDFDLVVISVHYEPDLVNILKMFIKGGISPFSEKRKGKPIVIAGGPPIISNPIPMSKFIDVLVAGEIESTMPFFMEKFFEYIGNPTGLLESLPPSKGFYVPSISMSEKVFINYAEKLDEKFHPIAQFRPAERKMGWIDATMIEASRGCFRMCNFCMEGHIFSYMRERCFEQILRIAEGGRRLNMTDKVSIVSLSFFDHSMSDRILEELVSRGFKVSIPSLRAETLNEHRLDLMKKAGQKTVTIAPETGSFRLALYIRKLIREDVAIEVAKMAKKKGFSGLKMYFMVGLPGETLEDLDRTVEYIRRVSEYSGFRGVRELKITVSPLVPKPHTPLERIPWIGLDEARKRIMYIKKKLRGLADVREYDPRWAMIQTVISRGDRQLGEFLLQWALEGGTLGGWRKALRKTSFNVEKYLGYLDGELPWKIIAVPFKPRIKRTSC